MKQIEVVNGRYIQNLDQKLDELKEVKYESYVIAKIQATTGLRVNEAREVARNLNDYYNPQSSELVGVIGKGNHEYSPKFIDDKLVLEIKKMENIPHYNTYRQDLKEVGINRHDFRVTYSKKLFQQKLESGTSYKKALKQVSKEINHHRIEMTVYYLNRV